MFYIVVNSSKGHCARADREILTDVPALVIVSVMRQNVSPYLVIRKFCHSNVMAHQGPYLRGNYWVDKLGRRVKEKVRLCCFLTSSSECYIELF